MIDTAPVTKPSSLQDAIEQIPFFMVSFIHFLDIKDDKETLHFVLHAFVEAVMNTWGFPCDNTEEERSYVCDFITEIQEQYRRVESNLSKLGIVSISDIEGESNG